MKRPTKTERDVADWREKRMLKEPPIKKLPEVERSAIGLRDALFDEINLLRQGKTTTSHARAIASLARQIIEAARLEFQQQKFLEATRKGSLQLGAGDAGR